MFVEIRCIAAEIWSQHGPFRLTGFVSQCTMRPVTSFFRFGSFLLAGLLAIGQSAGAQTSSLPAWRLSQELKISAANENLDRVYSMVVTRGGAMVVVDDANMMISTYDSTGRRVARGGGKGRGPGEMQMNNQDAMGTIGDSVWFYDPTQKRIVFYSSRGKHVRTAEVPLFASIADASPAQQVRLSPRGFLSDGSAIVLAASAVDARAASAPRITSIGILTRSGVITRILGSVSLSGTSISAASSTMQMTTVIPFVFRPRQEASADGAFALFVTATNGRDLVDTVRVTVVRSTGDTLYSMKQILPRQKIADSIFNQARENRLESARRSGVEDQIRGPLIKGMPRSFPAVNAAFVTREGRTWLGLSSERESGNWSWRATTKYLVISPAGKPEAMVTVPDGVTLVDSFGDRLWAFHEDDDGFRNIVRFRLHR
jgi:hypothetical protein